MLFERKPFLDSIRMMNPKDGKLFFRDSQDKGTFEVVAYKKSNFCNAVLMKAVFQTEGAGIFSDETDVIGNPFFANTKNIVSALSGKERFAEYKNGLFDGISVNRYVPDGTNSHPGGFAVSFLDYYDQQPNPEFSLVIPAGIHRTVAHGIKDFPSNDIVRPAMNTICFDFRDPGNIRIAATNGKTLAVYSIPGAVDESLKGMWSVSPDMFLIPPYNYESIKFSFSKEMVSMTIYGVPDAPVMTAYDVAQEWMHLKDIKCGLCSDVRDGRCTQKDADKKIEELVAEGPHAVFPTYERVIPDNLDQKVIFDKEEILLSLEKIKPLLYTGYKSDSNKVFVIDALDDQNITLTSVTDMDSMSLSYIRTQIPLKKAKVTHAMRIMFTENLFRMCLLEGNDRIEFSCLNARKTFMADGVDFFKGTSVRVKKIMMPFSLPDKFDEFGVAPPPVEDDEDSSNDEEDIADEEDVSEDSEDKNALESSEEDEEDFE